MGVGSAGLTNIDGMIQGVNYASAAAGIISSSGSELVCPPISPKKSMLSSIWQYCPDVVENLFGKRAILGADHGILLLIVVCSLQYGP